MCVCVCLYVYVCVYTLNPHLLSMGVEVFSVLYVVCLFVLCGVVLFASCHATFCYIRSLPVTVLSWIIRSTVKCCNFRETRGRSSLISWWKSDWPRKNKSKCMDSKTFLHQFFVYCMS